MIKITKTGWIYIVLTIVVGFAAVNTANNLIYILASALLSYMLVSGIFGRGNIHALSIQVEFPEEIYARTPTPITVRLTNPRRFLPAMLIRVVTTGRTVLFPYVAAASSSDAVIQVTFPHRGRCPIDPIRLASPFPFNFFTRFRTLDQPGELVIFPKPRNCAEVHARVEMNRRGGEQSVDRLGDAGDILAIRSYLPGDPLKHIHWKSTAKTGRIQTKEFAAVDEPDLVIAFDQVPVPDLEQRISCVTFRLLQLARGPRAFGLLIGGRLYPPRRSTAHKRALLRVLATHDQG